MAQIRDRPILLYACMLVSGFVIVIRHPAVFLIMPVIFILAWRLPEGSLQKAVLLCAIASQPLAVYLTWNWFTIHELVPQSKLDQLDMIKFNQADPRHVTTGVVNFPFTALWEGLATPNQTLGKKLEVLASVLVVIAALIRLFFTYRNAPSSREGVLALAFGTALFCHLLLHASLGFSVGFKWLDRYLANANPMIDWGLFHDRPLRWVWILLLIAGCTLFASLTGFGPNHIGFIR